MVARANSATSKHGIIQDLISKSLTTNDPKYINLLYEHGKDLLFPVVYNAIEWIYNYNKRFANLPNRTAILDSEHSDFWVEVPSDDQIGYLFERYWGEQATRVAKTLSSKLANELNGTNIGLIEEIYNKMRNILPPSEKPMIDAFEENWENMFDPVQNQALSLGLPIIDNTIFGINPGEQLALVGDTNVGKSWIACYLAAYQLLNGKNIVLVTGEMNKESVVTRISSFLSHTSPTRLRNKNDLAEMAKLKPLFYQAWDYLKKAGGKLWILDGIYSSDEIFNQIEKFSVECGKTVDLVIVDGQYLMKTNNGSSGRDWKVQAELAGEFYEMAFKNKLRLVTTNQLGRGNGGSTDITTSDISGSYDYARIASFMVGIIKPDQTTEFNNSSVLPSLTFKTMKMREGKVGEYDTISLDYDNVIYYKNDNGKRVDMLDGLTPSTITKNVAPYLMANKP